MRESVKTQAYIEDQVDFARSSREANPWSSHVLSTWLECEESWQLGFRECLAGKAFPRNTRETLCFAILSFLLYHTLCFAIVRSSFQRENPSIHTWELEIVIPTIIYIIPCGFPLLLPLHIHILERLIVQTLTTPNLSVKWGFGAVGKYWKKSIIGGCNRDELCDPTKLEKIRFRQTSW